MGGGEALDVGERGGAVDVRLAGAEEVEVGPVDEEDVAGHGCLLQGCVCVRLTN